MNVEKSEKINWIVYGEIKALITNDTLLMS
ncbi:hypothetical protein [Staphylococcus phage vB_ScaM-V1SC04]|nr:hypothetical protein METROID_105 [Staphylococcus phage Metroid]UXR08113.1 hypothetical protein [Staphylococcus phage vB_ScaM-V1SC04]